MPQQPIQPALTEDLVLRCLDPWGRSVTLVASFGYDLRDPFAVAITFHSSTGDVRWMMCREVLLRSLTQPAGRGDLELWPSLDDVGRPVVVLEFHSPDGRLAAQVGTDEVQRFLTRTLAAVPAGTESDHLDLDELIDALLGGSATQ